MKPKLLSFFRLLCSLLLIGSVLLNTSCNKSELEELKTSNAELQSQLDLRGSTITELEAQKVALEGQKLAADADIVALNEIIMKLERMIANKYVERYMPLIISDDFINIHWQHLYDEDFQLHTSTLLLSDPWNLSGWEIMDGETSKTRNAVFSYNYEEGVLVSTESDEIEIIWFFDNGRIIEIKKISKENPDEYSFYSINEESGNISSAKLSYSNGYTGTRNYTYNDNNLLIKEEWSDSYGSTTEYNYEYDANFNMIEYNGIRNGEKIEEWRWTFNDDGNVTKLIKKNTWEYDSTAISYNLDGSWEVYRELNDIYNGGQQNTFSRHYDMDKNLVYTYEKYGDSRPYKNEYEYIDGKQSKSIQYGYTQNVAGDWWVTNKSTTIFTRDDIGVVTAEEIEVIQYNENGDAVGGNLTVTRNIIWAANGYQKLSFSYEEYDYNTEALYSKQDYEYIENESGNLYQKKHTDYLVENGVALYINYSWDITEFFPESPFAGKTKVKKYFDANGETSSTTYVNAINSKYSWEWDWIASPG